MTRMKKRVYKALAVLLALFVCVYFLQRGWAHRHEEAEHTVCMPLLGWFTMEDRVPKEEGISFADLQPGDIILTLSTHSLGWRHGHAGLILDAENVLECTTWGKDSTIGGIDYWKTYADCTVLRVKGVTAEQQQEVVTYAKEYLCGVPYHLSAGFIGKKDLDVEDSRFGLQCAYLAWYAWNHFGYDLDSDGGRLVSTQDILDSELLEVVESFGIEVE